MQYGVGGFYQFEPYNTQLVNTCWMTIVYDQEEADSIDESSLGMYWEDKTNHKWVFMGGVLDTINNTVTAPIQHLSLFTLAPAMPFGTFGLNASPDSIYADSISVANFISDVIFNNNQTPVKDFELFTVSTSSGSIITPDVDSTRSGTQVAANNNKIQFSLRSSHIGGTATVSAFSVNGSANATTELRYYDTIPPAAPLLAEAIPDSTTTQLLWLPNIEDDISGYVLYFDTDTIPPFEGIHTVFGQPSPIYTGTDTSRVVYGLFNDTTYYFTLTAVDVEGNESDYSNFVAAIPLVPKQLQLQIPIGWSGISSYINPITDNVESMFDDVISDLIILQNSGGLFWPGQNINTLGSWDSHEGYQIKVANSVELTITGSRDNNRAIQLADGWNLIPVLSECDVDVAELFNGINLIMVKEVAGYNIYWPEFGINSLELVEPGKAYFVLMGSEGEVVFPDCDGLKTGVLRKTKGGTEPFSSLVSWKIAQPTALSHSIAIPYSVFENSDFSNYDFIGAFDELGNCFGITQWNGENTSITLFGNDPLTQEKDGFAENENIYFKAYGSTIKHEKELIVNWDQSLPQNDEMFYTHGISAISELKVSPINIEGKGKEEIMIYPNPVSDNVYVCFPEPCSATISIFDIKGRLLLSEVTTDTNALIDLSSFENGIYIIEIKGENFIKVERLIKK